jgi:hypothetical protein
MGAFLAFLAVIAFFGLAFAASVVITLWIMRRREDR